MKVLIILPDQAGSPETTPYNDLGRTVGLIRKRYASDDLHFVAPAGAREDYSALTAPQTVDSVSEFMVNPGFDEIVVVSSSAWSPALAWHPHQRVYSINASAFASSPRSGFVLLYPNKYDTREYPWLESHVFHRLGSRSHGFQNFAYGHLYLDPENGPIDSFGFRIAGDFRTLADRDPQHKLITIHGGSAAFSCMAQHEEMFAYLLEQMLNQRSGRYRYTVLNFGMHDHITMHEILSYLMFVQPLKPDIVISHGGHNDEWYGLQDDRYLLNHHQLVYQRHTEEWSKKLHNTEQVASPPMYSTTLDVQTINLPQQVIRAYILRKRQFKVVVESHGGVFLWGHQPCIWSKGGNSPLESEAIDFLFNRQAITFSRRIHRRIKMIHGMTSDRLATLDDIRLVDLHREFKALDANLTHFWDHVHYSPQGERQIADIYCRVISDLEDASMPRTKPKTKPRKHR